VLLTEELLLCLVEFWPFLDIFVAAAGCFFGLGVQDIKDWMSGLVRPLEE
jgi:hypothetical protein